VALALYFTPLIDFVKYPLIFISCVLGLFFSVGQINGQPSTIWVMNFISALFTSQERVWKKTSVTPEIFKDDLISKRRLEAPDLIVGKKKSPMIVMNDTPLISMPEPVMTQFDTEVENRLKNIEEHFNFLYKDLPKNYKMNVPQPELKESEKKKNIIIPPSQPETMNLASDFNIKEASKKILINDILNEVDVEDEEKKEIIKDTPEVILSNSLGEHINIIKGVVISKKGKFVENAQIYIKDGGDILLRKALSDKSGRFSLTTPLNDGEYYLDIEARGCKFPRFKVILNGTELPVYKFSEG